LLATLKKLQKRINYFKSDTGNACIHHNDIQAVFDLGSFFKSKKGFGYDVELSLKYRGIEFKEMGEFVSYFHHVITDGSHSHIFTNALIKAIAISMNKRLSWGHFISSLDRNWLNKLEKFIQQLERLLGKDKKAKQC
ncbi:hypothetical protein ACR9LT_07860, partial [Helicobacter pylori]